MNAIKSVWTFIQEGWKAVVALATPIVMAAIVDIIEALRQFVVLEYDTAIWVGVVSAILVWLKRNVPHHES